MRLAKWSARNELSKLTMLKGVGNVFKVPESKTDLCRNYAKEKRSPTHCPYISQGQKLPPETARN
jgi:hypothetical protein